MIEPCNWCGFSLYAEKEKVRQINCLGSRVVCCADSDACRARQDDKRRATRDLHEAELMRAGHRAHFYNK